MGFEELKARQSAIWGSAPWERVAETLADLHDDLVARVRPQGGEQWLDLAFAADRYRVAVISRVGLADENVRPSVAWTGLMSRSGLADGRARSVSGVGQPARAAAIAPRSTVFGGRSSQSW